MAPAKLNVLVWVLAVLSCGCATRGERAYVDADAEFRRAEELRLAGKDAAAAKAFERFAKRLDYDSRANYAQYLSGEGYLAAGNYDAALAAFDRLYRRFPYSPYLARANDRCLVIGKAMLKAGNSRGVEVLDHVAARAPYGATAVEAHMLLGAYYYKRGRFDQAKFEFDSIVAQSRQGAHPRAELSAALSEYRQIDRPARNLERLEAARRRLLRLRKQALSEKDERLAEKYLREIVDLGAERHLLMAAFYLKQGALEPAVAHLNKILEKFPTSRHRTRAENEIRFIQEARKATK